MSIARRQITRKVNQIIKGALQDGYFPTVTQVMRELNEAFKNKKPGQPTMQLRLAGHRQESSSSDWNQTIDEIYDDLSVVYEETLDQINRVLVDFDYAETERQNVYSQLAELESQIKNLLLISENSAGGGYFYSAYDTFTDLSKVDTTETSAFVDLDLGYVTTKTTKVGTEAVDLSGADITKTVLVDAIEGETISQLHRCIDGSIDSAWIERIKVREQGDVSVEVRIDLNDLDVDTATRLSIDLHESVRIDVDAFITEDGINWARLPQKHVLSQVAWDFSERTIKGIRIRLTKREGEQDVEKGGYNYYFGIKDVSLLKIGYEDNGVLVSIPHQIEDRQGRAVNLSKISLDVEDEVPAGTAINYYLALNVGGQLDWQSISPMRDTNPRHPKVIDLKSIANSTPDIYFGGNRYPDNTSLFNGMEFYRLAGPMVSSNAIRESIKLFKGIDQWKEEHYVYEWPEENHIPTLNDWSNVPNEVLNTGISTVYKDMYYLEGRSNESFIATKSQGNYRWSTMLFLEEDVDIKTKLLLSNGNPGYITVYVNNVEIKSEKVSPGRETSITYPLKKGWNSIQVLFYNDGPLDSIIVPGFSNTAGNNTTHLKRYAKEVRESDSMKLVDTFDLYYNVRSGETDFFAVENGNVVVNKSTMNLNTRYRLNYSYNVTNVTSKVLFKAEFIKPKDISVPPKLMSYRINATD